MAKRDEGSLTNPYFKAYDAVRSCLSTTDLILDIISESARYIDDWDEERIENHERLRSEFVNYLRDLKAFQKAAYEAIEPISEELLITFNEPAAMSDRAFGSYHEAAVYLTFNVSATIDAIALEAKKNAMSLSFDEYAALVLVPLPLDVPFEYFLEMRNHVWPTIDESLFQLVRKEAAIAAKRNGQSIKEFGTMFFWRGPKDDQSQPIFLTASQIINTYNIPPRNHSALRRKMLRWKEKPEIIEGTHWRQMNRNLRNEDEFSYNVELSKSEFTPYLPK